MPPACDRRDSRFRKLASMQDQVWKFSVMGFGEQMGEVSLGEMGDQAEK